MSHPKDELFLVKKSFFFHDPHDPHDPHAPHAVGTPRARQARGLRLHLAERRVAAGTIGLGRGAGDGAHGGTPGDGKLRHGIAMDSHNGWDIEWNLLLTIIFIQFLNVFNGFKQQTTL